MSATPRHLKLWRGLSPADRQAWRGLLRVFRSVVPRLNADLEREHRLPLSHYAGLVERRPGDADVRQTYVAITPRGLEIVADATSTHLRAVRDLFLDRLDSAEKDVLTRAFARILDTDTPRQPATHRRS